MTEMPADLADAEQRIVELLGLVERSDSVEIKLTIPERNQRSAVRSLALDPLEAQIRQVFFFDTPDLALSDAGVVARARRVQQKGEDAVIKLRPIQPDDLDPALRSSPDLTVEVDAMPGGHVCSATLKSSLSAGAVHEAVAGDRPLRKLFSKPQRQFFAAHAPEGIALDDLSVLGPIFVLKLKSPRGMRGRRLVTEMWLYPDGSRILELSTRCLTSEAFQVAAEARAFLAERGIDVVESEQETKTKRALTFFAEELQAAAGDRDEPAASTARKGKRAAGTATAAS